MTAIQVVCALALSAGATAFAVPAQADGNAPVRSGGAEPVAQRRWYGWQTPTPDGAAIALACASPFATTGEPEPALLALEGATYVLGGPIVDFAHGNLGTSAGTLAL